jgi:uncharacterized membrane protein
MLALRYVYVLALVVWLGGMVVIAALVAPTTVQVLQAAAPATGHALADELLGAVLARFHYLAYAAGAVLFLSLAIMAILGPRPPAFAVRMGIITLMLAVSVYAGIKAVSSTHLLMVNIAAALVLLAWEAREPNR